MLQGFHKCCNHGKMCLIQDGTKKPGACGTVNRFMMIAIVGFSGD